MADWIRQIMEQMGYAGIALLMLAENVFPPVPSELIMSLAGYHAAQGELSLLAVILAGSIGSLLGALLWYGLGRTLGLRRLERWAARHGRWLTLTPQDIDSAKGWFERHGGKSVLIGRLIPAVRTLISVPAGVLRMPIGRFLLLSALGTIIWSGALAWAGHALGEQHGIVERYVGTTSNFVMGAIVVWYLYRIVTFRRRAS